ncbi:hypothetical protein [Fodinicola feengrottensis]|uniref:hypothetical protein n=1 Tax=Fodinicola feengrottensis TaxID=435914 RepID=UPI0013D27F31|nr:hypothetical protein [Fodinicola feengrottensis]
MSATVVTATTARATAGRVKIDLLDNANNIAAPIPSHRTSAQPNAGTAPHSRPRFANKKKTGKVRRNRTNSQIDHKTPYGEVKSLHC